MKNVREIVVVSVLAAALAGCGGGDQPESGADTTEVPESTTTTTPDDDGTADRPEASGDLDAVAEAVAAAVGRADVGAAGASLGLFADWLPAPADAQVADAAVQVGRPQDISGDAVVGSRVQLEYLTAEGPDALRPLYDAAATAEGWQPAPGGWRTSDDDRASVARAEFHTADGYKGPAIEVTVVTFKEQPDVHQVELVHRADLTAEEVESTPELGDSLALRQDEVPVSDRFELVRGSLRIDQFGGGVDLEVSWTHSESLDHAEVAEEIADALPAGGWSVAGEAEATGSSLTTYPLAFDGWTRPALEVSSSPDSKSTSVTFRAKRSFGLEGAAPTPAPGGPSATDDQPA